MTDLARVKIFRFDPAVDKEPRYDTFDGIVYEGRSVLEVIQAVYEERDQTLAYRQGCFNGTCVGCAVVVNGKALLACQVPAGKKMVIEPHPKYRIIKDLAVDYNEIRR
jgi:succinate dehydrogenase/fumarate reductase-like Fe-S protein